MTHELLLVAGSGRSGTSLFTGMVNRLGFYVPQPEVEADASNPRGFSEPQWVVDFHQQLLARSATQIADGRPAAWAAAAKAMQGDWIRDTLTGWVRDQLGKHDRVVVKDPRLLWFLPLWLATARDLDARPGVVTMLRHPAEVVHSKASWYGASVSDTHRAVGWINTTLYTERATRDVPRSLVRYEELLDDWTAAIGRVSDDLGMTSLRESSSELQIAASELIDPSLRRSDATWDDLDVPKSVIELCERVWRELLGLTRDAKASGAQRALDECRAEHLRMYTEAEAIASSSLIAAAQRPGKRSATDAHGSGAKRRWVLRLARLVPTRVRHRLPLRVRQAIVSKPA